MYQSGIIAYKFHASNECFSWYCFITCTAFMPSLNYSQSNYLHTDMQIYSP